MIENIITEFSIQVIHHQSIVVWFGSLGIDLNMSWFKFLPTGVTQSISFSIVSQLSIPLKSTRNWLCLGLSPVLWVWLVKNRCLLVLVSPSIKHLLLNPCNNSSSVYSCWYLRLNYCPDVIFETTDIMGGEEKIIIMTAMHSNIKLQLLKLSSIVLHSAWLLEINQLRAFL